MDSGWRLDGAAVFRHHGLQARLGYRVACDAEWRTLDSFVQGWVGAQDIDLRVGRTPDGVWALNGNFVPHLEGCLDLDLGFTPATNLFQLRRIARQIGQAATVPVAWLDVPAGGLESRISVTNGAPRQCIGMRRRDSTTPLPLRSDRSVSSANIRVCGRRSPDQHWVSPPKAGFSLGGEDG